MLKYWFFAAAVLTALCVFGFLRASWENERLIQTEILAGATPVSIDLRPAVYAGLPAPVRRYFNFAFNGQAEVSVRAVSFRQTGQFLLPVGEFYANGRQISRPLSPVYAWTGTFHRFGLPLIESRDAFLETRHNMRAKLLGWLTVMQTKYEQPEQIASLHSYLTLRYYGQAPVFPWALLPNEHVSWEPCDDTTAVLRITRPDLAGAYIVRFGADGRIEEMASDRALMEGNETMQFEVGRKLDYREVNGFMVPTKLEYLWTLEDGSVSSRFQSEVHDVELL